jgi:hypothetical protein
MRGIHFKKRRQLCKYNSLVALKVGIERPTDGKSRHSFAENYRAKISRRIDGIGGLLTDEATLMPVGRIAGFLGKLYSH